MTINGDIVSLSSVAAAGNAGAARPAAGSARTHAAPAVAGADRVELSLGKAQVERLRQTAAGEPEFRAEKVANIKQQIEAGSYQIDPRAVAAKIAALQG
ncbi:flagellar biosynthesis anti-sigma factor FlgM [Geobacter sp.]|uniref:flagellar biosynthesis anti-sigma factor FlgM n=1 Tax=Geobacter sp. TaxID=46610 RepID=UPI002634B6DE|nr:flagellar biosynthesis anti-sigma factor FlgM [Geobacter sp.]